jgi:hypothetical protein
MSRITAGRVKRLEARIRSTSQPNHVAREETLRDIHTGAVGSRPKENEMKPYDLYQVEVAHNSRYVTSVSARSSAEAHRKVWKKIAKKNPKLVVFFRENPFICIPNNDSGLWGNANGI